MKKQMPNSNYQQALHQALSLVARDADAAKAQLETLRQDSPGRLGAIMALAFLYSRELQFDRSLELVREAILIEPDNERTHFNLGYIHQQLGDIQRASKGYRDAWELSRREYFEAGLLHGMCLHQQGRIDEARSVCESLMENPMRDVRLDFFAVCLFKETSNTDAVKLHQHSLVSAVGKKPEVIPDFVRFFTTYDDPKWQVLDHKAKLKGAVSQYTKRHEKEPDFHPTTFVLPTEMVLFEAYFRQHPEKPYWLVKPESMSGGQGAYVITSPDEIKDKSASVVQHYIHNPLLVDGRKFNLRLYLVVMQVNADSVYGWRDGIVFISPETYGLEGDDLRNARIHIVNPLLHLDNKNLHIAGELDQDSQSDLMRWTTLCKKLTERKINVATIKDRLQQLMLFVMKVAQASEPDSGNSSPVTKYA
ncbi:MAG: hypothetical protein GXP30_14945, partial [Verrucomicrobia bacterium]|nr:hypothetical protein [Verrucomicrobiota bacterium]